MLKEERQKQILDILKRDGKVVATEISKKLGVSEDTIRRDLRELDDNGLLHRVHGGALPKSPSAISFDDREKYASDVKEALAKTALQLVQSGQVIIMDGSTTVLKVAEQFPTHISATIITNSPPIAVALARCPMLDVVMLGGQLVKDHLVNVGPTTSDELGNIRADLCFLGVYSIHPEIGITIPHLPETYIKKKMIANSTEVAALVTKEKLGTSAPYIISSVDALSYLITEKNVPKETLLPYRKLGVTVLQSEH